MSAALLLPHCGTIGRRAVNRGADCSFGGCPTQPSFLVEWEVFVCLLCIHSFSMVPLYFPTHSQTRRMNGAPSVAFQCLLLRRLRVCGRFVHGACAGHSQTAQPVACLRGFDGTRVTRDKTVQLTNAGVALAKLQQSITLLQLRRCRFAATGILLQYLVIIFGSG